MGQQRPQIGEISGDLAEDDDHDSESAAMESLEPLPEFSEEEDEEYVGDSQQEETFEVDNSSEINHRDDNGGASAQENAGNGNGPGDPTRTIDFSPRISVLSNEAVARCVSDFDLDGDPDSPSSEASPPVKEVHITDDSTEAAYTQYRPGKKALAYGLAFWIVMLIVVVMLEKSGVEVPKPDISLDDFFERAYLPNWDSWMLLGNESVSSRYATTSRLRPGYQLAQQGAKANYPIVMIPGFVTSGLELWEGKECARKHFRERLWGGVGSARQFIMDRDCWKEHLALNPLTGGDPEHIRLRPAQGFEAADYFIGNYWVWGKLIENLADVGYDGSTMHVASYDWRMSFPMLEKRDGYMTKLKHTIEAMHETTGKKVVLAAHSMGSQLLIYFFAWVVAPKEEGGGGGGKDWVDRHVHTFVNIAGPLLGVVKATPALLSGEMRDTSVLLGTFGSFVEQFFGRRLRKNLWTTWGSLWAMLPTGGNAIWGVGADIYGEQEFLKEDDSLVPLITLTDDAMQTQPTNYSMSHCNDTEKENLGDEIALSKMIDEFSQQRNVSVEQAVAFLSKWGGGHGPSLASAKDFSFDREEKLSSRTWHDPSRTPLPYAPLMKVYCLYGVGLNTERGYFYRKNDAEKTPDAHENITKCHNHHYDPPFVLNNQVNDAERKVAYGVRFSDGDGSVPLLSLGYLCADAWKRSDSGLNPSKSEIITREYKHRQEFSVDDPMRSGPYSADHVDVLGNSQMTEDFIRIVTGFNVSELKTQLQSDIEAISKRINAHPQGGLFAKKRRASDALRVLSKVVSGSFM